MKPTTLPPPRNDWFSLLTGFAETNCEVVRSGIEIIPGPDGHSSMMKSLANQTEYNVGEFTTPSLQELRNKCRDIPMNGKIKLTVELGDVAAKHARRENRLATFQVASQFNCLEFVSQDVLPEEGVTGYAHDRTQGPACAISCGPATIFRNYFVPLDLNGNIVVECGGSVSQKGQSVQLQINNIKDFARIVGSEIENRYFQVVGGYVLTDTRKLQDFNMAMKNDDARNAHAAESLRIGVHTDVQVTSQDWGRTQVIEKDQLVTQVFGSACPISYNSGTSVKDWELLARTVLRSSYEATLRVALLNANRHGFREASNRVFLTCLGGGVFGNPTAWIADAIEGALEKLENYELDVRIVCYSGVEPEINELVRNRSRV